jgi:hypothetical protein
MAPIDIPLLPTYAPPLTSHFLWLLADPFVICQRQNCKTVPFLMRRSFVVTSRMHSPSSLQCSKSFSVVTSLVLHMYSLFTDKSYSFAIGCCCHWRPTSISMFHRGLLTSHSLLSFGMLTSHSVLVLCILTSPLQAHSKIHSPEYTFDTLKNNLNPPKRSY